MTATRRVTPFTGREKTETIARFATAVVRIAYVLPLPAVSVVSGVLTIVNTSDFSFAR